MAYIINYRSLINLLKNSVFLNRNLNARHAKSQKLPQQTLVLSSLPYPTTFLLNNDLLIKKMRNVKYELKIVCLKIITN